MQVARHYDDDDIYIYIYIYISAAAAVASSHPNCMKSDDFLSHYLFPISHRFWLVEKSEKRCWVIYQGPLASFSLF